MVIRSVWSHEKSLLWLGLALLSTAQAAPLRLLSLDWAAAETAQALGVTPVGMAQLTDYRIWWYADAGECGQCWFAYGAQFGADCPVEAGLDPIAPFQQGLRPLLLQRIAPVRVIEFNSYQQPDSYRQAQAATRQLAIWLDRRAGGGEPDCPYRGNLAGFGGTGG